MCVIWTQRNPVSMWVNGITAYASRRCTAVIIYGRPRMHSAVDICRVTSSSVITNVMMWVRRQTLYGQPIYAALQDAGYVHCPVVLLLFRAFAAYLCAGGLLVPNILPHFMCVWGGTVHFWFRGSLLWPPMMMML